MSRASAAKRPAVPSSVSPNGFRPEIQGLRAIAVLAVLVFHIWPTRLSGGYVGVDVFFVISGFLITGLLLRQAEFSGRINVLDFYVRRIKRLVPAATLVLVVVGLCISLLPITRWSDTANEIAASALYFENWWLAAKAVDYLAAESAPSPLQHFWSLSIEEQYYIAWPLLFAAFGALLRRSRDARHVFGVIIVSIGVVSLAYSAWLTPKDPGLAYFATTTRAWELALGGALAVFTAWERWPEGSRRTLGAFGLIMVLWAAVAFDRTTPFPGYQALLPTVGAAFLIVSGTATSRLSVYRLLQSRPLQYVGDLSYSLYLWHWPAIIFYREIAGREIGLVDGMVVAGVSLALSHQTKVLVEDTFRRRGFVENATWKPFAFAALCVSLPVLCWWSINVQVDRLAAGYPTESVSEQAVGGKPRGASGIAGIRPALSVARKDVPKIYKSKCHVGLSDHEPRACVVGGQTTGPKVFVVGDSHAAQWLPAYESVERELGWQIRSYTKSACAFADVVVVGGRSGGAYESCTLWNEALLAVMETERPQIVLVSQSRAYVVVGKERNTSFAPLVEGLAARWRKLQRLGVDVVVLADTPRLGIDVPECLSKPKATVERCARTASQVLARPDPLLVAAEQVGVPVVSMNDVICPGETCPPVIDGVLVWRDSHHVSATFAAETGPELARRLASKLQLH